MSAKFSIDGSSAGAVKAVEQLNKALDATAKGAEGAVAPTKRLTDQAKQLAAQADPQERYNQKMEKLRQAVAGGGLELTKAQSLAARYGSELEKAGNKGNQAFGASATSQIAGYVAGLGSITAIAGTIKAAFVEADQASRQAAANIFGALGQLAELQQLGPAGYKKAMAIANMLTASGAVAPGDRGKAIDIGSNMVNAGFTASEVDFLTGDVSQIVSADNLNKVGGDLKKTMTQFGEKDLEKVADQVLTAANSTQADLATTVNEMLKFGGLAAATGSDLDDAAAAFVVAEGQAASPAAAAENLASFYSQVYSRGLGGKSLEETMGNIRKAIPKGGNAFDVLGDKNAVLGFEALDKGWAQWETENAKIRAAQGTVTSATGVMQSNDPMAYSAKLKARAQGREALTTEQADSESINLHDAYRAELNEEGKKRGEWATTRWLRNRNLDADVTEDDRIRAFQGEQINEELHGRRISPELDKAMEDYLQRNNAMLEQLGEALDRQTSAAEKTAANTDKIAQQQNKGMVTRNT